MPKEVIASRWNDLSKEENFGSDLYLQVLWGSENGVQIATVNPAAEVGSIESGLYVDLDRKGINHAIRALRKSRDQAFGRDE